MEGGGGRKEERAKEEGEKDLLSCMEIIFKSSYSHPQLSSGHGAG